MIPKIIFGGGGGGGFLMLIKGHPLVVFFITNFKKILFGNFVICNLQCQSSFILLHNYLLSINWRTNYSNFKTLYLKLRNRRKLKQYDNFQFSKHNYVRNLIIRTKISDLGKVSFFMFVYSISLVQVFSSFFTDCKDSVC